MRRAVGILAAVTFAALLSTAALAAPSLSAPSLGEPALSPDGSEIAFVSGGDIWTVPAGGGIARLLVTDPATESRPVYSPDGTRLAFTSNRAGRANIYLLDFASGAVKRLTFADAGEALNGWSRDGKWIYFTSGVNDAGGEGDIFRVSADGGTPLEVSREAYLNEFQAAPSPDGTKIALMAKGISDSQWWRNGHSHIDETELWVKPVAEGAPYTRLLPGGAKHAYPMWRPDGGALYYMSDESGTENIWRLDLKGLALDGSAPVQITHFTDGRVLWPSIGYDGRTIVFERDFGVWSLDLASGEARPVSVTLRGAPAAEGPHHLTTGAFSGMALSPDGKKVAVIAHGQVFAAPSKDGGPGQLISRTGGAHRDLAWSPDSRRLVYVAEDGLDAHLVQYDFATGKETALTTAKGVVFAPLYAPDGKSIAYVHNEDEARVLTLGTDGADRLLFTGALQGEDETLAWSPDSHWLAFAVTDHKAFRNIDVVEATGGPARPISFLANGQTANRIAWSPDGKYIVFDTAQRSEGYNLVRVDLVPHLPKYREDAFQDLFKSGPDKGPSTPGKPDKAPPAKPDAPAATAASDGPGGDDADASDGKGKDAGKTPPKPVHIVFDGIRDRATILPLGMSAQAPVISPNGKTLVFAAQLGERQNLYSYSLDELSLEPASPEQLTSSEKAKADYAFTPDSKTVFYRDGDRVFSTPVDQPKAKPLAMTAEMDVDFDTEKMVVFDEAWDVLNRRFYDAGFGGHDWAALRETFKPQIAGARTGDEERRIINLMIGELNASHSGIYKRGGGGDNAHAANLGLRFDREAFEAGKGLVVRQVINLGPASIEGSIKPGERLVAIDGTVIGAHDNLDALLMSKAGKRTVLTVAGAGGERHVTVKPVSAQTAAGLTYRQWVDDQRAFVDKISGGRLGYVHIPDMSDESLAQLYLDLDTQNQSKEGVVIDIRNNDGGYVNGYALDVFARRNYMTMTPRGMFPVPSRSALGQRALGLPTVLITNESSLSDAEDFSEGYRALGLGKIVGTPTAGWIIYTDGASLVDGSLVRVPQVRVQDGRGQTMEMHPRPVDVEVAKPLGESGLGHDAQLEAAVKVLLDQVGGK